MITAETMEDQKIEGVPGRVMSGVVQFDDDWPGIFIRGDEALGLANDIDKALQADDAIRVVVLGRIAEILKTCRVA